MNTKTLVLYTALVILLATAGCAPALSNTPAPTVAQQATTTATGSAQATVQPQPTLAPTRVPKQDPVEGATTWVADGIIGAGEYAHQKMVGDVEVFWRNDDQYLYLAAKGRTTGWVAVGLMPEFKMQGANMLIGAIVDGQAEVDDQFGTTQVTHESDIALGGTNDIVASGGTVADGFTIWEAQIPLDSGDQYDKPLTPGQTVLVIAAMSTEKGFWIPHVSRANTDITLD